MNSNKQTKIVLLVVFLFAVCQFTAVLSLGDKEKPRVKITPAIEVVNKFNNVAALGTVCPRSGPDIEPALPVSDAVGEENSHCLDCRMGVYFRRSADVVSCSYCNSERKG